MNTKNMADAVLHRIKRFKGRAVRILSESVFDRRSVWLIIVIMFAGLLQACDKPQISHGQLDALPTAQKVSYSQQIKPIFESRCIACHSCYDAPCQLKLTSYSGVSRGGSKDQVYEATRLKEAPLSRLFFDGSSTQQWREKGFHDVLLKSNQSTPDSKVGHSTLTGMLDLKQAAVNKKESNDLPPLNDQETWQCNANREEFLEFAQKYPNRGMPYALPHLTLEQHNTIKNWVVQGAIDDSDYQLTGAEREAIQKWEAVLNRDSLKNQLVARYIYEHLFLANLYFESASKDRRFFQLVRSRTPPGQPIEVIATRRPFDDPGVMRPYYRIRLVREAIVAKTHMPYLLDHQKHEKWSQWFFERDYSVNKLPTYDIESASNPFKTFAALPVKSRYQFMLDEAEFTVRGFIKGPVCKGQSAVNVISEHFWVFFLDPDAQSGAEMLQYLENTKAILDLPAEQEDTLNLLGSWDEYAEREREFLLRRNTYIDTQLKEDGQLGAGLIWDGESTNPNAALTVFRHFDHASVRKGLLGQPPKTAWVIDYPLLERIHYLLVAGFDVYGNISHQLLSRIYMDFLRMEGESLFLAFLERQDRASLRQYWYRDADQRIEDFMSLTDVLLESGSIVKGSADPKGSLIDVFRQRIAPALEDKYSLTTIPQEAIIKSIEHLQSVQSEGFALLPDTTLVELVGNGDIRYFTLIKHVGHTNNSSILFEESNIVDNETRVSFVPGFIAPRPDLFLLLDLERFSELAHLLLTLKNETDYDELVQRFGVVRTDPEFWAYYDRINQGYHQFDGVAAGWLDLNSYGYRR